MVGPSVKFKKGDVVIVMFPFSDLSISKPRPALALFSEGDDVILCQITSKNRRDSHSVRLTNGDFTAGSLHKESNIRTSKIFMAEKSIIAKRAGTVSKNILAEVDNRIREWLFERM